jgi:poly(ADP-ribose) glycohydrolase ARH3
LGKLQNIIGYPQEATDMVLKKRSRDELESFKGSLIGCAVGDALGSEFEGTSEFVSASDLTFSGRWTDDTHMMIGVAESPIENKGFDGRSMALTFVRHFEEEPWRGYGSGPPQAFRWIKSGAPWREASKRLFGGAGSLGNGAAMRVAPIGLLYHDDSSMLRSVAYESSQITHAHQLAKEGAAIEAYAVAISINSRLTQQLEKTHPSDLLGELKRFAKVEVYRRKFDLVEELLTEPSRYKIRSKLGNGGEASESVPTAIYCFLRNINSFKEALLYAVSLGGDTDTIAAMTGAMSGAYHGYAAIPERWRSGLEQKDYIESLAEKLWHIKTTGTAK